MYIIIYIIKRVSFLLKLKLSRRVWGKHCKDSTEKNAHLAKQIFNRQFQEKFRFIQVTKVDKKEPSKRRDYRLEKEDGGQSSKQIHIELC